MFQTDRGIRGFGANDSSGSRRDALAGLAGVIGSITFVAPALAQANHNHSGHAAPASAPKPRQALVETALACVGKGEICLNHCFSLLGAGDTSLKNCVRTVSAMIPACGALARFAALDAPRLKDLAKLCIDVCTDCETECRKHQDHHAECKACAESCAECIRACKALIAA